MKKNILFAFFLLLVVLALYFSVSVFLISLIGVGFGVLIAPTLSLFERKFSMPRALSALFFFLFVVLLIAAALFGVWYIASDQLSSLIERAPEITRKLNEQVSAFLDQYPWLKEQLDGFSVSTTAKNFVARFFKGLQIGFEVLAGLAFAFVLGLHTAIKLPEYFSAISCMFAASQREVAKKILHQCASNLRLWLKAQATDMAILGVITTLSLWAIGVEFWAVYGLMTAVFTIVPYIGIVLVVIIASLITLASDPAMVKWVLVVFTITQQIEANVILPLIMKGKVNLPEVPLLIFILFLGTWFGLLGVFIAPPLFAVMRVLYLEIYLPKMNRS